MYHIIEGGGGAQDSLAPIPTTTLFLNIFLLILRVEH